MKKRNNKKLCFYIVMAILSFLMVGVCFYIGIKFDKHGETPYIIIPVVLGVISFLGLTLYFLLKIYPYANEYDKKRLRQKKFKYITINSQINDLKQFFKSKFDNDNNDGVKTSRHGWFGKIIYKVVFCDKNDINEITQKIIDNNKITNIKTETNFDRFVDIYFIEIDKINDDITLMEQALDEQYLGILKDPEKIILPLIYECNSQKLYYYEKWTQTNITVLRFASNYIKKQLKKYQTNNNQ